MASAVDHGHDPELGLRSSSSSGASRPLASFTFSHRYHDYPQYRRPQYFEPLINRIDNAWLDEKNLVHDDDDDDDDFHRHRNDDDDPERYPDFCDIDDPTPAHLLRRLWTRSVRARKMLSLLLLIYLLFKLIHTVWISPWLLEDQLWRGGLDKQRGGYGVQSPSQLAGILQTAELDDQLLPGGEHDPHGQRRLIFVGDIHGCAEELKVLLQTVVFDSKRDHLVHTGDVLAKGPDSPGVIDILIGANASGVRGNWDDRILTASQSFHAQERMKPLQQMVLEEAQKNRRPSKEAALLAELKHHHLTYLKSLPLVLTIPFQTTILQHHRLRKHIRSPLFVVHAGLVPAVPLSRQDPISIMTMRYIDPLSHIPHPERLTGSVEWDKLAPPREDAKKSGELLGALGLGSLAKKKHPIEKDRIDTPTVVVYGHNARAGARLEDDWSMGLDGACVSGGRLTAVTLDAWGRREVVSVRCKDYRSQGEE
ncbi:hypothetical protein ANO11243_069050 [Dothideomycetidae sp. 11243]|nr:hypothetical protein ANO11243_069050 [fungal sp. No.11243]